MCVVVLGFISLETDSKIHVSVQEVLLRCSFRSSIYEGVEETEVRQGERLD